MTTNAMVGIYSLAASFGGILVAIWSALNNCWCPFLFEYLRTNQYQKIVNHGKNYLELYTILTIGFMLLAPEVFHVFAATEYWGGTDLIPVFAYNAYFGFLYAFPVNYQFYLKKTKLIAVGTVVAGICNIIMNWFFIQWWHISGAALATMFSSVLLFLFHHFIVIKTCKLEYPFHLKMLAPYAFVVLVIFTIVMTNIFSWPIRWGIGVLIGVWEFYRIVRRKSIF